MTPEQNSAPIVFQAPSTPPLGRTALAFVLAAVVLIGVALGYRAMGRNRRSAESGMPHCLRAENYAQLAQHRAGATLWGRAASEYRLALRANPRLSRARRGLAAVLWLQRDLKGARDAMKPEADVPAARRDVWVATQAAFGAGVRPKDAATLRRYRTALEATDLGWSRYVALQALSSTKAEAAMWERARTRVDPGSRALQAAWSLLIFFGFVGGVAILIYSLSRPWANRIPRLAVPVTSFIFVWLVGLAVQSLPAIAAERVFGPGLDRATGDLYYVVMLAVHTSGALLALWLAHAVLKQYKVSFRDIGWSVRGAPVWAIGGYLALAPVMLAASGISSAGARLFPNVETPINSAELWTLSARGWGVVFVFLTVCVVGPFVEELLFRGFLFRGLAKPFGTTGAAVLSSAVFASIHPQLPLGFLPIMCIGIALCVVYQRSGSLTASWMLHGLNNAVIMFMSLTVHGR
jgi:membrane protease YdiL (CAAX protease family)